LIDTRLQGHLFGARTELPDLLGSEDQNKNHRLNYLHTVEEIDQAEASPSKSALQIESQLTEESPL